MLGGRGAGTTAFAQREGLFWTRRPPAEMSPAKGPGSRGSIRRALTSLLTTQRRHTPGTHSFAAMRDVGPPVAPRSAGRPSPSRPRRLASSAPAPPPCMCRVRRNRSLRATTGGSIPQQTTLGLPSWELVTLRAILRPSCVWTPSHAAFSSVIPPNWLGYRQDVLSSTQPSWL
jgi:hypothetical protein